MPALKARSQMHPLIAHGHAFRANLNLGRNIMAVREMFANWHRPPPIVFPDAIKCGAVEVDAAPAMHPIRPGPTQIIEP